MPKQSDDLSRKDEPSQETEKGLRIPVPKRADFGEFFEGVKKKPTKKADKETSSPRDRS